MSARDYGRRQRQKALKADAAILLERFLIRFGKAPDQGPATVPVTPLTDREARMVQEMILRLRPPTGVKAPIVLTGFTRKKA